MSHRSIHPCENSKPPPTRGKSIQFSESCSKPGVIKPTGSSPAPFMTSITLATWENSTTASPRINTTRFARIYCLCGMIMKTTSSTSRTSINGTTFTSVMIPRFEPSTDIVMSHLASEDAPRGGLSQPCADRLFAAVLPEQNYWPASSLAVIKPTLSMPALRMTSIARATS